MTDEPESEELREALKRIHGIEAKVELLKKAIEEVLDFYFDHKRIPEIFKNELTNEVYQLRSYMEMGISVLRLKAMGRYGSVGAGTGVDALGDPFSDAENYMIKVSNNLLKFKGPEVKGLEEKLRTRFLAAYKEMLLEKRALEE